MDGGVGVFVGFGGDRDVGGGIFGHVCGVFVGLRGQCHQWLDYLGHLADFVFGGEHVGHEKLGARGAGRLLVRNRQRDCFGHLPVDFPPCPTLLGDF